MKLFQNKAVVGLVALRILRYIIEIFASSFLMLYFFSLNPNTIVPVALYYLVVYSVIFICFFALINVVKSGNKVLLLRLSILFKCAFFVCIALLKERVVDYVWLVGLFYGLDAGFFYSAFNFLVSEKITNKKRISYLSIMAIVFGLISILVPIIFGSVLEFMPYDKIAIIVLVLVALQLFFSFFVQSSISDTKEKCNFKGFKQCLKKRENKAVKNVFWVIALYGLTISGSALVSLATLYLIFIFSGGFSFGMSSAVLALASMAAGFVGAKILGKKLYKVSMWVSAIMIILSIIALVIYTNNVTIIIFNLFVAFFNQIIVMQSEKLMFNISNYKGISKFKPEYFVTCELAYFVGRAISYVLMLLAGIFYSDFFIGTVLIILGLCFVPFIILANKVNHQTITDEQNLNSEPIDEKING